MAREMILNFKIDGPNVEFDVEGGDGTTCEVLARVFTDEGQAQVNRKPEYERPVAATSKRATA